MKIEFSYAWYQKTCKENNLNTDNIMAKFYINQAKEQSKKMKYFMDALKRYENDKYAAPRIKEQIKWHNEKRIENMLEALEKARGKDND